MLFGGIYYIFDPIRTFFIKNKILNRFSFFDLPDLSKWVTLFNNNESNILTKSSFLDNVDKYLKELENELKIKPSTQFLFICARKFYSSYRI